MSVDPTGFEIAVLIRPYPAVVAITSLVRGGERLAGWEPPFVILKRISSVRWIGDPGTETAGVQTVRYTALCYAQRVENGEYLAFRLAGAVEDAVDNLRLRTFPLTGGRAALYGIQLDSTGPRLDDPITGEPYVPVNFSALASAQLLAPVSP